MGKNGGQPMEMIEVQAKDVIKAFIKTGETMAVMGSEPEGKNNDFMLLINFDLDTADYWEETKVGGVTLDRSGMEFTIKAMQQILEKM